MLLPLWPEVGLPSNSLPLSEPSNDGSVRSSRQARAGLTERLGGSARAGRRPTMRPVATTKEPRKPAGDKGRREAYDAPRWGPGVLSRTWSGVEKEPLYTPEADAVDYARDLGNPGEFPFT